VKDERESEEERTIYDDLFEEDSLGDEDWEEWTLH